MKMDVSLRHWPLFVTGLLLGAAGTMSLGLHRPTQAELAAAAPPPAASARVVAVTAPPAPPTAEQLAERAEEQMRTAFESFRAQEALAAAAAPDALVAQAPKPRIRRVAKAPETDIAAATPATGSPIAIATSAAPEPADPGRMRPAPSVMGGAPEGGEFRSQSE
jgi:hypothetical protein